MPSSRFSGLYLSGRTLAIVVIIVGVAGTMAFYRGHTAAAPAPAGITYATQQPLPTQAVSGLINLDKEQERLAEYVAPAVVAINVTSRTGGQDGDQGDDSEDQGGQGGGEQGGVPPDNPFSRFFGQIGPRRPRFERGLGSGIIISPDGYIVTNNHVVSGSTSITVTLHDNRSLTAKVIGTDPLTDLAVVKIAATGLPNLPWGDSKVLKQGDNVFAFGNPFRFKFTMTHGIVSGKGRAGASSNNRAPGDYIQTDAAINPGNSGGPLVNSRGQVVGVNAFIFTSTGAFSGESFAIPSEIAEPISTILIQKGKVVRGYLGITITTLDPDMAPFFHLPSSAEGALVTAVTPGQAGAEGGLKSGDLIVSFNGAKIADPTQLQLDTGAVAPGKQARIGILRDGKPMTLTITLGRAPGEENQAQPSARSSNAPTGARLGLELEDLTPRLRDRFQLPDSVQGVVISAVTPGGPAYNAELEPGMVLTEINRVPVKNLVEANAELRKLPPGSDVLLRLLMPGGQGGAIYVVVHSAPVGSGQ